MRTEREIELAAAESEAILDTLDLTTADVDVDDMRDLRAVAVAAQDLDTAHAGLARAVKVARDGGRSWTRIGTALGISRQAAQQRFGAV